MSKGKWDTTAWGNGPSDGASGEYTPGEGRRIEQWMKKTYAGAGLSIVLDHLCHVINCNPNLAGGQKRREVFRFCLGVHSSGIAYFKVIGQSSRRLTLSQYLNVNLELPFDEIVRNVPVDFLRRKRAMMCLCCTIQAVLRCGRGYRSTALGTAGWAYGAASLVYTAPRSTAWTKHGETKALSVRGAQLSMLFLLKWLCPGCLLDLRGVFWLLA